MSDEEDILKNSRTIAVVGLSSNPLRHSHKVAHYLRAQGYRVIPVNPTENEVLGETSYPDLAAVPEKVDVVDIFRRSEEALPVVEAAIKQGIKAVWMQEGVVNQAAAELGQRAGLTVVMDKCMMKEHQKLKR